MKPIKAIVIVSSSIIIIITLLWCNISAINRNKGQNEKKVKEFRTYIAIKEVFLNSDLQDRRW